MKYILALILFISLSISVNAQRGHVEKAMQQKYMDQYGQPGADKLNDYMSSTFGGKTEASYTFPMYLNMHIIEYKGGKKDETDVKYYVNTSTSDFAFGGISNSKNKKDAEDMTIVFDYKNSSIIMLNDNEKTGMAINFGMFMSSGNFQSQAQKNYQNEMQDVSCSSTGKSKNIQGYSCAQYQCIDKDKKGSHADIWVSKEVPVDIKKSSNFGIWSMHFMNVAGINGMMMEGQFYENDKLTSSIEVTELNKNANYQVNMSDYKMGFGAAGGR